MGMTVDQHEQQRCSELLQGDIEEAEVFSSAAKLY